MTISSYARGHKIIFYNNEWVYEDTLESILNNERTCKNCGNLPTKEGYDSCLGELKNVISACCGHGLEESYIVEKD